MTSKAGRLLVVATAASVLAACAGISPIPGRAPGDADATAQVSARPIHSPADLQNLTPLTAGDYRVHLIDVGTGLAILVQGHDFTLLYDGGSADDKRGLSSTLGNRSRLVAYLYGAIGPSAVAGCDPVGDTWDRAHAVQNPLIDHVLLSHPHEDHGSLLDDVLACYDVGHVWDSGAINDAVFYRDFVAAAAAEGATYHTATAPPADRTVTVR